MRATLGWTFAILVYAAGVVLIIRQPFWWYPNRAEPIAAAAPVASSASPPLPALSPPLTLIAPEVKELFALYQRHTHHLPRNARDFLLERIQSWHHLSPDLQAETVTILRQLPHLDRYQALEYLRQLQANALNRTTEQRPLPAHWEE